MIQFCSIFALVVRIVSKSKRPQALFVVRIQARKNFLRHSSSGIVRFTDTKFSKKLNSFPLEKN
jgi:hypothetical protein